MLTWIREKFGTVIIGSIIALITFVFAFYGVFSPKASRLGGAVAGSVNGDPIPIREFNRELNRRIEFFKQLSGGKLTDEQIKAFRVREGVFQELVRRKLLIQEADRLGMVAGDEEVRSKILEMPVFRKNGQFDVETYKQVLAANNLTPAAYERMVREDASLQQWQDYFKNRVHVSDTELKREFMASENQRNIKYVLLTSENARKGVQVGADEVKKFLADAGKLNLAKNRYEARKTTDYKGLTFDAAKEKVARDLIATDKFDQVRAVNEKLASRVLGLLRAGKGSDAKVNALLKPYGAAIKSTGLINQLKPYLPGIGQANDLMKDAFAENSPIDGTHGGKAKKYGSGEWLVVAIVSEVQKPDLAKLASQHEVWLKKIISHKEELLFAGWMKKLVEKAKIETNPAVFNDS